MKGISVRAYEMFVLLDAAIRGEQTHTKFECQRCGKCCKQRGDIPLMPADIIYICQYLNISREELFSKYLKWDKKTNKLLVKAHENDDKTCIFFEPGKGCRIHPVKPAICYKFPFIELEKGKFLVQDIECAKAGKELKPITDVIADTSNRYLTEQELVDRYCKIVDKIYAISQKIQKDVEQKEQQAKTDKCKPRAAHTQQKANQIRKENEEFLNRLFEMMYVNIDVNVARTDIVAYVDEIFEQVEEIIMFFEN